MWENKLTIGAIFAILFLGSFSGPMGFFQTNTQLAFAATSLSLEQCHNWDSGTEMHVDCEWPNGSPTNTWGTGLAGSSNAQMQSGHSQNYRIIMENEKEDKNLKFMQ